MCPHDFSHTCIIMLVCICHCPPDNRQHYRGEPERERRGGGPAAGAATRGREAVAGGPR